MEPVDDPKLKQLLREWRISNAPPSLDARVLGQRSRWWDFLLTGSIRVPVPVGIAIVVILLAMGAALLRQKPVTPAASPVNLVDFQPAQNLNVRVIGGKL